MEAEEREAWEDSLGASNLESEEVSAVSVSEGVRVGFGHGEAVESEEMLVAVLMAGGQVIPGGRWWW